MKNATRRTELREGGEECLILKAAAFPFRHTDEQTGGQTEGETHRRQRVGRKQGFSPCRWRRLHGRRPRLGSCQLAMRAPPMREFRQVVVLSSSPLLTQSVNPPLYRLSKRFFSS